MAAGPSLFDDGKDPQALRTIGEVASALQIRQHVLRYWEQHFPMLSPLKRSGGRRLYRPEDVELVAAIDRMVNREGYTLRGARMALQKGNKPGPAATAIPESSFAQNGPLSQDGGPAQPPHLSPGGVASRLREIRARLAAALDR